jgi:hypothetical protein
VSTRDLISEHIANYSPEQFWAREARAAARQGRMPVTTITSPDQVSVSDFKDGLRQLAALRGISEAEQRDRVQRRAGRDARMTDLTLALAAEAADAARSGEYLALADSPALEAGSDDDGEVEAAAAAEEEIIWLMQAHPRECRLDPLKMSAGTARLENRRTASQPATRYPDDPGYDNDGPTVGLSQADRDEADSKVGEYLALAATAGRPARYDSPAPAYEVDVTSYPDSTATGEQLDEIDRLVREGAAANGLVNDSGNRRTRSPNAPGGSADTSAHGQRGRGPWSSYSGYRGPARVVPNQYSGDRYYG